MKKELKIAIIGVGLIGGSIALGLKQKIGSKIFILGSCSSPKRTKRALELGIIDEGVNNPQNLPKDVDCVILATPIEDTIKIMSQVPKDLLTLDVCSIKSPLYKHVKSRQKFIGTHPMAGSEHGGFESANANLFRNKPWVICEGVNTTIDDTLLVKHIINLLGAKSIELDAKKHDELVSLSSHLPFLVSSALMSTALHSKNWDEAQNVASTGFRDTTRLSSTNTNLRKAIALLNRSALLKDLSQFESEIVTLKKLVRKSEGQKLEVYFAKTKKERDKWIER